MIDKCASPASVVFTFPMEEEEEEGEGEGGWITFVAEEEEEERGEEEEEEEEEVQREVCNLVPVFAIALSRWSRRSLLSSRTHR